MAGFGLDHSIAARTTTRTLVKMAMGETAFTLAHVLFEMAQEAFPLSLGAVKTELTLRSLFTKLVAMGDELEEITLALE